MRARSPKHGDTGRTRAAFLHSCLKFDIKELQAGSPFQCSPAPVDHISARLLLTPGFIHMPVTRAQTTRVAALFKRIDDPQFKKKQMREYCGTLPTAVSLRISPLPVSPRGSRLGLQDAPLKEGLVFYCSDSSHFYSHACGCFQARLVGSLVFVMCIKSHTGWEVEPKKDLKKTK